MAPSRYQFVTSPGEPSLLSKRHGFRWGRKLPSWSLVQDGSRGWGKDLRKDLCWRTSALRLSHGNTSQHIQEHQVGTSYPLPLSGADEEWGKSWETCSALISTRRCFHLMFLTAAEHQGCQEPNPSAAPHGPQGNLALALCLVLNKNFIPNFVFLGWSGKIHSQSLCLPAQRARQAQQEECNKQQAPVLCKVSMQISIVISHLYCYAEL